MKKYLKDHPKYEEGKSIVASFIDLEDYYFDHEDENDLSELVPLLKPLDDIPRFRVKNLQRFEVRREKEDVLFKRSSSKWDEIKG